MEKWATCTELSPSGIQVAQPNGAAVCEPIPAPARSNCVSSNFLGNSRAARRGNDSQRSQALKLLQISDTHLHAAADSRMRGVTTYATFLAVLEQAKRDRALARRRDPRHGRHRSGREPRRLRALSRRARAARRARLLDPGQPRRPEAHGRDPHERLVPARRRAAPRRVVDRAAQHVPRRRGRRRPRPRAPFRACAKRSHAHAGQHVLVAMHHHPLPMGSAWLDGVALRDAASVLENHRRAQRRPRQSSAATCIKRPTARAINVRFMSTPSTCAQFLPGSEFFALDERAARHALDRALRRRPHRDRKSAGSAHVTARAWLAAARGRAAGRLSRPPIPPPGA